jgi:hypothetical protein
VHNELIFLPVWVEHYSKQVPLTDIYILDHESNDGSTERVPEGCHVLRVSNGGVHDVAFLLGNVKSALKTLLERYNAVLFAGENNPCSSTPYWLH